MSRLPLVASVILVTLIVGSCGKSWTEGSRLAPGTFAPWTGAPTVNLPVRRNVLETYMRNLDVRVSIWDGSIPDVVEKYVPRARTPACQQPNAIVFSFADDSFFRSKLGRRYVAYVGLDDMVRCVEDQSLDVGS